MLYESTVCCKIYTAIMEADFAKLLLFLVINAALGDRNSSTSEFPIRRSRVLSTWQSSFGDGQTCFYNRSQSEEATVLKDTKVSHKFLHSASKSQADGGFHWFAVQLNEPVLISSVTVKGREDGTSFTYNRVIGIELWTSSWSGQLFSGDHCSSRYMSRQFNEWLLRWRLCGMINKTLDSVTHGEAIAVYCENGTREIRHLLVRKNVSSKVPGSNDDDVISFSDLRMQTAQLDPVKFGTHSDSAQMAEQSKNLVFPAIASVLSVIFVALIFGFVLLKVRRRKARPTSAMQLSPGPAKMRLEPRVGATDAQRQSGSYSSPSSCEPECSYMSVSRDGLAPSDNESDMDDTDSDCTVYAAIVADAD